MTKPSGLPERLVLRQRLESYLAVAKDASQSDDARDAKRAALTQLSTFLRIEGVVRKHLVDVVIFAATWAIRRRHGVDRTV